MIKFFRKIRQKLVEQNRASKYLLYALGEIILVVIGILIALQINNWNENRKDNLQEAVFIKQLKEDLTQTNNELDEIKAFFLKRALAAQTVIHSYWQDKPLQDSLLYNFGEVLQNLKYNPILGTAKSLINSGNIELIKSEKLKTAIINYNETVDALLKDITRYEETYYRTAIHAINNEFDIQSLYMTYNTEDYKIYLSNLRKSKDTYLHFVPENFKKVPFTESLNDIYNNKNVFAAYKTIFIAHRNTSGRYSDIHKETKKLLQLLKEEGYD